MSGVSVTCRFEQPDAGNLHWQDKPLARLRPHQLAGLGIGRTLQRLGLFDAIAVLENVMVRAERHARVGFWSGLLGVASYADRSPASGLSADEITEPQQLIRELGSRMAVLDFGWVIARGGASR